MKVWMVAMACILMLLSTITLGVVLSERELTKISSPEQAEPSIVFVSGTEYKPGQDGQIIVEARYPNGTSALEAHTTCYQGAFNTSSVCGGVANNETYLAYQGGDNVSFGDIYDYTGGTRYFAGVDVLFNYTKPSGFGSAVLTMKIGGDGYYSVGSGLTLNYIIPQDCWDYNPDKVILGLRLGRDGAISPYYQLSAAYCRNSTGWNRFHLTGAIFNYAGGTGASTGAINKLFDNNWSTGSCPSQTGYPSSYWYTGCYVTNVTNYDSPSLAYEFAMNWNVSCLTSIWYPDKTPYIINETMYFHSSSGNEYLDFAVPNIDGVYEYQSTCLINGNTYTASKSFHVTKPRIRAEVVK